MEDIQRRINMGIFYMGFIDNNIEKGLRYTSRALLLETKKIIDEYPEHTTVLNLRYQKAQQEYETKFGKLEKELQ